MSRDPYKELRAALGLPPVEEEVRTRNLIMIHGKCGHSWEPEEVGDLCQDSSCNCGQPLSYRAGKCPVCGHTPGFLELPLFQHIGWGIGNIEAIKRLELKE